MARGKGRKTGGKRHRGGKRSALDKISNGSIRRLARRGGVKRISKTVYADTRVVVH
jgi:histone H4